MISPELRNVASVLASTHRRYPDELPDVLPLFAGIVLFTHRELIAPCFTRNLTGHGTSHRNRDSGPG